MPGRAISCVSPGATCNKTEMATCPLHSSKLPAHFHRFSALALARLFRHSCAAQNKKKPNRKISMASIPAAMSHYEQKKRPTHSGHMCAEFVRGARRSRCMLSPPDTLRPSQASRASSARRALAWPAVPCAERKRSKANMNEKNTH